MKTAELREMSAEQLWGILSGFTLRAAGAAVPADRVIDGGDLLPAIAGKPVERARPLYWRCVIAPEPLKTAMRIGDWKILADAALTEFEVYDLRTDPKESKDLAHRSINS